MNSPAATNTVSQLKVINPKRQNGRGTARQAGGLNHLSIVAAVPESGLKSNVLISWPEILL